MKKIILSLLLISACRACASSLLVLSGSPPGAVAATYLYQQNFDTGAAPVGELGGGAIYDYATSPAPLQGTYSAQLNAVSVYSVSRFSGKDEIWAYFLFNSTSASIAQLFALENSGYSMVASVTVASGTVTIHCGSATANTSGTISANTTYSCWVHYLKGSGSNATAEVHLSTTTTKPADASALHAKTTAGTSTDQCAEFEWNNGAAGNFIIDNVFFDDAAIGSNPN